MFEELYTDILLDHNKTPRCSMPLSDFDAETEAYNPLCGDKVKIQIKFQEDRVKDIAIISTGCAISVASGSLLADVVVGKTREEIKQISNTFRNALTQNTEGDLGKLEVLKGVKHYPIRIKCATMVHHALLEILDAQDESVSDCSTAV